MQQVEQYRDGERDYMLIKGDTGGWHTTTRGAGGRAPISLFSRGLSLVVQVLWSTRQRICSYTMLSTCSLIKGRIFSSLSVYLRSCILEL